jgi:hypothetical protein
MHDHTVLILLGTAGVAATFAGFSGVVAVFGRRAQGEWFPEERFRLTNMLVISLGACLFAFVPLIEELFHSAERTLWTTASTLLGAFCVAYFLYALPQRWRLSRSRPGLLPVWASAMFILCLCFAMVLQALNAVAALFERGAGAYVAGLLLLLIAAGLQFAFLVLTPLGPAESGEPAAEQGAAPDRGGR